MNIICITEIRFQSNSSITAESAGSISFMVELTVPSDTVITVQVCTEETTPSPSAGGSYNQLLPIAYVKQCM